MEDGDRKGGDGVQCTWKGESDNQKRHWGGEEDGDGKHERDIEIREEALGLGRR